MASARCSEQNAQAGTKQVFGMNLFVHSVLTTQLFTDGIFTDVLHGGPQVVFLHLDAGRSLCEFASVGEWTIRASEVVRQVHQVVCCLACQLLGPI